jgi:hypothetical protein
MATVDANNLSKSSDLPENSLDRIDIELQHCDYFLLLLSPQAAVSEMALEELRLAKELRFIHHKPIVLPIRVNCPLNSSLNHDLRGYLQGIEQLEWESPADTATLVQEVLNLLASKGDWGDGSGKV